MEVLLTFLNPVKPLAFTFNAEFQINVVRLNDVMHISSLTFYQYLTFGSALWFQILELNLSRT